MRPKMGMWDSEIDAAKSRETEMAQNEPKSAGEEALLTFVNWIVGMEDVADTTRRRISLQDIIDRAKLARKFYEPSPREQIVERIQKSISLIPSKNGYLVDREWMDIAKQYLPDILIEEFQTEFSMLLDPDQDGPY
jgi:hypothetical protein